MVDRFIILYLKISLVGGILHILILTRGRIIICFNDKHMIKRSSFEKWRKVFVEIPSLLTNCETWTKLLKLSEPQFHHMYSGFLICISQIKCVNNCKTSNIPWTF